MRPLDIVEYAFTDFANSKFKTFMSCLGIIIGVMAIVAMLTLGDTINSVFGDMSGNMDLDTIVVDTPASIGVTSAQIHQFGIKEQPAKLTGRDIDLIMGIPGVSKVSPRIETSAEAAYGDENETTAVVGLMPQYEDRLAGYIARGRFLTPSDTNSVVLGSNVVNYTFGKKVKLGDHITLINPATGKPFEYAVVGTLKQVNATAYSGDVNSAILMTPAGLRAISAQSSFTRIIVRVDDISKENDILSSICKAMLRIHKNEIFIPLSAVDYYEREQSGYDEIKYVLGGIGAISLLVGGIGIMNVMMLTVRERTKEIGLMKAVGATTADVRMIFLIESMLMGLLGGAIGVGIAALAGAVIGYLGHFAVSVSPQNALAGITFGLVSTLVFGVYPASQASRLDPIDALRAE